MAGSAGMTPHAKYILYSKLKIYVQFYFHYGTGYDIMNNRVYLLILKRADIFFNRVIKYAVK